MQTDATLALVQCYVASLEVAIFYQSRTAFISLLNLYNMGSAMLLLGAAGVPGFTSRLPIVS